MYDLLSSISHGLLPEVAPTGATLNQVWVNINQLNTQSSALRAHTIRKQLYQLSLNHPNQFGKWSSSLYTWFQELQAITGTAIPGEEKLSIMKLSLGDQFTQLRQGLETQPGLTLKQLWN